MDKIKLLLSRLFFNLTMVIFIFLFFTKTEIAQEFHLKNQTYRFVDGRWFKFDYEKKGDPIIPDRIIVRLANQKTLNDSYLNNLGLENVKIISRKLLGGFYVLKVINNKDPFLTVSKIVDSNEFDLVEFDALGKFLNEPNDDLYEEQWNMPNVEMPSAWNISSGNSSIILAMIDSGVDFYHEDLDHNIWVNSEEDDGDGIPEFTPIGWGGDLDGIDNDENGFVDDLVGWDFYEEEGDNFPFPDLGNEHGTAVAGIAVAETNNEQGVAGVAGGWGISKGVSLMSLRHYYVIFWGEETAASSVAQCIDYAVNNGANVISMSLAFSSNHAVLESAVEDAVNEFGCVIVAGAGNNGCPSCSTYIAYPARYDEVIAVGANLDDDTRWVETNYGSSFGPELDLMAPGGESSIYTTDISGEDGGNSYDEDYLDDFGGTSASAPVVAGIASLILSIDQSLSWQEVRNILHNASVKVSGMGGQNRTDYYGYGRIDANLALVLARGYGHINQNISFSHDVQLTGDLIVDEGATLTIQPDVTVTFAANSDAYNEGDYSSLAEFIVKGKVIINGGSTGNEIVFQSSSGQPQSWGGIRFEDESSDLSQIKYCKIRDAYIGLKLDHANPTVTNNLVLSNMWGVLLWYSHTDFTHNEIFSNTSNGLMIWNANGLGDLTIEDNDITGNTGRGVYVSNSSPIFLGNYISGNGLHGIEGFNQFDADLYDDEGAGNTIFANDQRGVSIGSNSTPCLGTNSKHGDNYILQNGSFELYYGGGSHCTAQYNYWGADPPDEEEFYTTETITYDPWLSDPPRNSNPVSFSILQTNRSDSSKFSQFNTLYFNGNYKSAIKLGLVLLDSLKQHSRAANVLGLLWHAFRKTNNLPGFVTLLENLIQNYPNKKIYGWAKMFKASILAINKDYTTVLQLYQSVANQFPNSRLECKALFEQFLIYFMEIKDYTNAQIVLSALQKKYPNSEFTLCAIELYNTCSPAIGFPQINRSITSISQNTQKIKEFKLYQNYPNPFNPETVLRYDLPQQEVVVLEIYDIAGRKIRTLMNKSMQAGNHQVVWNSRDEYGNRVASGLYFYRIKAGSFQDIKKMVLLR